MTWLTLEGLSRRVVMFGVCSVAVWAGCSDDGLAPQTEGTAGPSTGLAGEDSAAVTTTATVTATDTSVDDGGSDDRSDAGQTAGDTIGIDDSDSGGTRGTFDSSGDGTGDGSGSGSGSGPSEGQPCVVDEDCVLLDDCCACSGMLADDPAPTCDLECKATACEVAGFPEHPVECRFGTCELVDVDCNQALVLCDLPPPVCPEGMLPSVAAGCWSGNCVSPEACDYVPDCSWCAEDEVCVPQFTQIGAWTICEPVDPSCAGAPTCECMGNEVCEAPYECFPDQTQPFACSCPVCG